MQMFGIGLPELMVVLVLTVLVVGPDRMPAFAADLARWIRRTRAYATHLTKDFNEVIGELEKEAGASREDWKEIASVVGLHTGEVTKELQKVASQIESSIQIETGLEGSSNVVAFESTSRQPTATPPPMGSEPADESAPAAANDAAEGEEKPWYVPEPPRRRRSTE